MSERTRLEHWDTVPKRKVEAREHSSSAVHCPSVLLALEPRTWQPFRDFEVGLGSMSSVWKERSLQVVAVAKGQVFWREAERCLPGACDSQSAQQQGSLHAHWRLEPSTVGPGVSRPVPWLRPRPAFFVHAAVMDGWLYSVQDLVGVEEDGGRVEWQLRTYSYPGEAEGSYANVGCLVAGFCAHRKKLRVWQQVRIERLPWQQLCKWFDLDWEREFVASTRMVRFHGVGHGEKTRTQQTMSLKLVVLALCNWGVNAYQHAWRRRGAAMLVSLVEALVHRDFCSIELLEAAWASTGFAGCGCARWTGVATTVWRSCAPATTLRGTHRQRWPCSW